MHSVKPVRMTRSKELILAHLQRLSLSDRYLRFCSALSDHAIQIYVDKLKLIREDVVFGVYDDSGTKLIGMLHIAPDTKDSAEFALSVDSDARKQGIGDTLFERGLLHCESVGIKRIYMNCLSSNEAIKSMARKRKMVITTDHGETIADLDLNNDGSVRAFLASIQSDAIGLYDLSCKHTRHHWDEYVKQVSALLERR